MSTRSIAVRLRAEVADFNRQISSAATSLDDVVKASGRGEKAADTFMGRVAQSAQLQSEAWSTVGTTLTVAGGAVTGLGAAVLATGVSYNTLRQTSVAALTTLTGSAEDANRQMDRLDAFASTSPFARDVFIRAQQQMLGFGIEAGKVVPYLDAIQNAVAATGGSNEDIAELARILSQVHATGKITAETLNQLGYRGVDAATLIGSQMGKTGAQIREDITDGALDAGVALDALAAGMQESYGGAADNVKDTFAGAIDRVKAAWRDMSSVMAEPLVSRDGGGLAVGALNALADSLRAFLSLPDGLVIATGAVTGLVGAATLGAGGLLLAVPKYMQFRTSLESLSSIAPTASRWIGTFAGAVGRLAGAAMIIGGVTLAVGAFSRAMKTEGTAREAREVASAIREINDAGGNLAELRMDQIFSEMPTWGFDRVTIESENLRDALERLTDPGFAGTISDIFGNFGLPSWMHDTADAVKIADEALASMADEGNVDEIRRQIADMGLSSEQAAELLPQTTAALQGLEDAALGAGDGAAAAAEGIDEAREASEAFMLALAEGSQGFVDILGGWDAVIEKNREVAQAEADRANEGKKANSDSLKSWEDYYNGTTVSMSDYLDQLETQVEAQREWEANMTVLAGRVSEGTLQELARLGPEGAPLVAALVDASDDELARFEDVMVAGSSTAATEFAAGLIEAIPLIRAAMTSMGDESIAELAERLRTGQSTIQEEIDAWAFGPPAPIDLDADTSMAWDTANEFYTGVTAWHPPMAPIDADTTPAEGAVLLFGDGVETSPFTSTIDADTDPAYLGLAGLLADVDQSKEDIDVGADTSGATTTVANWSPGSKSISISADLANARQAIANWNPAKQIRLLGNALAADGGLWEASVRRYADGGIDQGGNYVPRVSQIVQGGRNILWGEPETGWEAYISGKPAARARNLDILDDVARRFGGQFVRPMEDGGQVAAWRSYQSTPQPAYRPLPVAPAFPSRVTLVDESGGILAHARVVARDEIGEADRRQKASLS